MKYFLLLVILFSLNSLNAQYGTSYQFHFTLQDSTTGFNSATDPHHVKTRKRGRCLLIKTEDYHYQISSEAGYPLSIQDGKMIIAYGVIPPRTKLNFTVQRRERGTKATFHLSLTYLQDDDFAELYWLPDSLKLDLSYGQDLIDYELITSKTADGNRDLSCLLLRKCNPVWQLTQRGAEKEEARKILKFEQIKYRLQGQIDSLTAAHFPDGLFSQHFDLKCTTGYYLSNAPVTKKCELAVDTSLVGMMQLYQMKTPQLTPPFYLYIYNNEGPGAYFGNYVFGKKQFSKAELNFLTPEEIGQFAQKEFPDIGFTMDENGLPVATLIYLGEQPQNTYERPENPLEQRNIPVKKESSWPGTFAYYLHRPVSQMGRLYDYESYYFYAHKAQFILKTENYYDLLDE